MQLSKSIGKYLLKNPESTLPLMKRLLSENYKKHIRGYIFAFIMMAIVAATTAASAYIMKDIINEIFINRNENMLYIIAGAVLVIYILKGAATYGQNVTLTKIGNNLIATNQKRMYDHLLKQGVKYYDDNQLGDLSTRMARNAQSARDVINLVIVSLGRDLFTLIGLIAVIISQNSAMALVALVTALPAILVVARLVRKVRVIAKAELLSFARILSTMQETVLGIRVIKAFGIEPKMREAMYDSISSVEDRANHIAILQARTSPLMETLGGIAVATIILWGGYSVIHLGADPGSFFAFITALLMAYEPAKRLARLNVQLSAGMMGVKLMYELLDSPLVQQQAANAKDLTNCKGKVTFKDVVFDYNDEKPALKGFSFTANVNQTTALVGPSGAGKSTVLSLIERYYDADSGSITIDDINIKDLSFKSLRSQMALVTQDTFLFAGTVAENIKRGRDGATEAEMIQAAKDANAHDFIMALPAGYDTEIGEDGGTLSGGQRQRIAIARAMLRNAPILLLDEATSALDAQSEVKIQTALDRLMVGKTAIIIAHRLSTIRNADKIVVMDKGTAIEEGTHADLIKEGALYRTLHDLQFQT